MLTVTVVGPAGPGWDGTVTVQLLVVGQDTPAAVPPKLTVMSPDRLNRFDPVRLTVCPGAAESGVIDATTGAPGGGGAVVGGTAVVGGAGVVGAAPGAGDEPAAVRGARTAGRAATAGW